MELEGSLLDEADLGVDALDSSVAEAVFEGGVDERGHPPDAPRHAHHRLEA